MVGNPGCMAHSHPDPCLLFLRVLLMLRERWHFCRDGRVLLGSRALRERHLGLMGYQLLPVSCCPALPSSFPHSQSTGNLLPSPHSCPSRSWSHREACPSSRAT